MIFEGGCVRTQSTPSATPLYKNWLQKKTCTWRNHFPHFFINGILPNKCSHVRAYSSSLLRAIIACNDLPFFKIFSKFAYFCPNFQIFWPLTFFLPFSALFLKNRKHTLTFYNRPCMKKSSRVCIKSCFRYFHKI